MATTATKQAVANAHRYASQLRAAPNLAAVCAIVARPDFNATYRVLKADGGYPKTVADMEEFMKLCRDSARPGAPPGPRTRGGPAARMPAPGGARGGQGEAPRGPAVGPTTSPGGARGGAKGGKPGGAPGSSGFGWFGGFPIWVLVLGYVALKGGDK